MNRCRAFCFTFELDASFRCRIDGCHNLPKLVVFVLVGKVPSEVSGLETASMRFRPNLDEVQILQAGGAL